MNDTTSSSRPARICFLQTVALLLIGLVPFPMGWARSARDTARSPELNRANRDANAAGYYQGLIGVDGPTGAPNELAARLIGTKPSDGRRVYATYVSHDLSDDPLMFELRPEVNRMIFGQPFATNSFGIRGPATTKSKPDGVYRIVVLGSSMDMGWGVDIESTYVYLLEQWLNAHAAKRGIARRFEVLNFAVAAYSPVQRLESLRRKASEFHPDLVLYSATMLDLRLMEIHLCDMFRAGVDLSYGYLEQIVAQAGITPNDLIIHPERRDLVKKDVVKAKLRPYYWPIYEATMSRLDAECHSLGVPMAGLIIPRVSKADAPDARAETVSQLRQILSRHCVSVFDLSDTFDAVDPAKVEIAPWDDHPNALGHRRLFRALANQLVKDPLYETLFPAQNLAAAGAPLPEPHRDRADIPLTAGKGQP